MADKFTAEEIDSLFENKYFQAALKRRLLSTPYTIVASVGALVGLGGFAIAVGWFNKQYSSLNEIVQKDKQQIAQLHEDVKAEKDRLNAEFSHAKDDLNREIASVTRQGASLQSTSVAVTGAVNMATSAINTSQTALRNQQSALVDQFKGLNQQEQALKDRQQANLDAQKRIEADQQEINRKFAEIQSHNTLLDEAKSNAEKATVTATQLQGKIHDLSSFKTFELVTLHAHTSKVIALKQIQSASATPVDFSLEFRIFGLHKPVKVELTVRGGGAGEGVYTYPAINPDDPLRDSWPAFCICGTPWMFQGENWVQEKFIKDFLTLRVVGRQDRCLPPENVSRQECTDTSKIARTLNQREAIAPSGSQHP